MAGKALAKTTVAPFFVPQSLGGTVDALGSLPRRRN
jgi:hypothetical protein